MSLTTSPGPVTKEPIGKRVSRVIKTVTGKTLLWAALILFAIFSVVPMLWLLLAPSKQQAELISLNPLAFGTFQGYLNSWNNLMVFQDGRLLTWLGNSIWYTTLIVLIACMTRSTG